MKIKLSKNKKIIILISGFGILATSIVIPIVVINSNKNDDQESENRVREIISKIKDKDILIAPNVSTKNQSEIQSAIKNQLQKENQTLTLNDLSKISTNILSLTLGNRIETNLTIKVNSVSQNLKIYVEKANLLKNSNITSGDNGTIFQDEFKNLWAMGRRKKLQVLRVNSDKTGYVNVWSDNNTQGLLKNSNVTNGTYGKIFQDFFKNLWTMSAGKKLQVLKVNNSKDGYVNEGWTDNNTQGLLNGSNITDGYEGTIFQDLFGNLWVMGNTTKLQVLKVNSKKDGYVNVWSVENTQGLLNGSNIIDGNGGKIFQDEFKNLWTMGLNQKLQVLKANSRGDGYVSAWNDDKNLEGLLKNSNITNGNDGTIFQDEFKNLWTAGNGTKLQVLKANSKKDDYVSAWTDNKNISGLLNGSNIINGNGGKIFQDEFKNLWTMGTRTKLQVLKVNSDKSGYENAWSDDNTQGLLNGSNITNWNNGTIFQDEFKNLWILGWNIKLQVLKVNINENGYVDSWQN